MLASDLHVHLDGSLRESTLVELACERGAWPDSAPGREYAARMRFGPGMSLRECLSRFEATVALLQSADALARVAGELVEDSYLDGARHLEVRLCPALHTRAGLSAEAVLEAVIAGLDDGVNAVGRAFPHDLVSARVIVTALEGMTEDQAGSLVTLAARYRDGVCGVDLAGDETLFDAGRYGGLFSRARDAGLGITVHAGEAGGAEHVREAVIEYGARRIGLGVAAARNAAVMGLLAERGVVVEACLSSNVHTGAVGRIEDHPLRTFLAHGVRVVIATDNRFFSSTTLSAEYDVARERLGVTEEEAGRMAVESARAAFLSEAERGALEGLYAVAAGRVGPRMPGGRTGEPPRPGDGR